MTTATQTTRMTDSQIAESGAVLARAFHDDPLTNYWIPEDEKRRTALPWFMTTATKYGHKHGEVETTVGTVEGNAVWLPPGKTHVPPLQMMLAGMYMAPFKLGWSNFQRFMKSLDLFEKLHKDAVPEDHWYLMVIGVDPPRQGQGIGSALMQPALAKADAAHVPCYLETQKEINVKLYRKHGFEVVVEDDTPDGGLHYWTMKRPAR
jgi:ribosomal protein S18 acetylase RimI-like enzyme